MLSKKQFSRALYWVEEIILKEKNYITFLNNELKNDEILNQFKKRETLLFNLKNNILKKEKLDKLNTLLIEIKFFDKENQGRSCHHNRKWVRQRHCAPNSV